MTVFEQIFFLHYGILWYYIHFISTWAALLTLVCQSGEICDKKSKPPQKSLSHHRRYIRDDNWITDKYLMMVNQIYSRILQTNIDSHSCNREIDPREKGIVSDTDTERSLDRKSLWRNPWHVKLKGGISASFTERSEWEILIV